MSFPAYPAYRDSGVAWLGRVPAHWEIMRLKRAAHLCTERAEDRRFPVGLEHIESWTGRLIEAEAEFEGEGVAFQSGDILFGKLRPYLAKAWLADQRGEAVGDFHVIRPLPPNAPEFFQRVLLSREVISLIDGSTYGAKMPRASWAFIGALTIPLPPPAEQRAIASFLDRECGKIDALVAEQERLIALLKEKRQAVISHAVTKGLDPNAPMKDGGVAWLGQVPAHWEVKRLKQYAGDVTVGVVVTPSQYYADDGVPALRSLNVREMAINLENLVYFDGEASKALTKSMLRTDDIVAIRTGKPGTTAVVPPELDGANCIDLIVIRRSSHFVSRFLAYLMNSTTFQVQYAEGSAGALQQHFNIETAGNLRVALPPVEEQAAIVTFLDRACGKLDTLITEAERAIALLKERRAALISAAVTGKIDVRGLVAAIEAEAA
jgi:type I restriction enzyme S subunit